MSSVDAFSHKRSSGVASLLGSNGCSDGFYTTANHQKQLKTCINHFSVETNHKGI